MKKIEEMNEDNNRVKMESRRKINFLEEELDQNKNIKDLFLKQIIELKKLANQ